MGTIKSLVAKEQHTCNSTVAPCFTFLSHQEEQAEDFSPKLELCSSQDRVALSQNHRTRHARVRGETIILPNRDCAAQLPKPAHMLQTIAWDNEEFVKGQR